MSSAQKFNVGDRVRVVTSRMGGEDFVGRYGFVVSTFGDMPCVILDKDDKIRVLSDDQLAAVSVKVVEGVIGDDEEGRWVGESKLDELLDDCEQGDTVRLTVEVIRKAGESK